MGLAFSIGGLSLFSSCVFRFCNGNLLFSKKVMARSSAIQLRFEKLQSCAAQNIPCKAGTKLQEIEEMRSNSLISERAQN